MLMPKAPGVILPRHERAAVERQKKREAAAANSISGAPRHRIDSDDFISKPEVQAQLDKLITYVVSRREEEPDYQLLQPLGWKITLLMLSIPETTAGGVHIVDEARNAREIATPQGIVLGLGPLAYNDPARFSVDGEIKPWVKVGDRIQCVKYDAHMFQIANGQRLASLNDTQPVALIDSGWEVPT